MSEEYQKAQAELVSSHIAKQDIVITTALIPGRAAPRLITDAQIATMRPGSVIFDLAVAQGGNVEGCVPDQVVETARGEDHRLLEPRQPPAGRRQRAVQPQPLQLPLRLLGQGDGKPVLDEEIGNAVRLTQGGEIVNERLKG